MNWWRAPRSDCCPHECDDDHISGHISVKPSDITLGLFEAMVRLEITEDARVLNEVP
jgi:hypothetical protein